MKRLVVISAVSLLLLAVTPVLASRNNDKGEGKRAEQNEIISPSASPLATCDPDDSWKNHGAYVSCVAKLHLGGKEIPEAARSEIGKKSESEDSEDKNDDDDDATPSASPTSSPSASPSATPSVSPTPIGIGDTNPNSTLVQGTKIEISALIQILENIIKSLKHLITK